MERQERERAQPVGRGGVELLGRPVVPRRVGRVLQLGVGDREAERQRPVHDRRRETVAVHVLEPQLRRPGAVAVVVDAGAPDRAELLHQLLVLRHAAAADDAALAHPLRALALVDDTRAALGEFTR